VDFDEDKGFAIISSNKKLPPVFAIIERGTYSKALQSGNAGFKSFIESAQTLSSGNGPDIPVIPGPVERIEFKFVNDTIIDNCPRKINAIWGQFGIFGTQCPNGCVGCGPLAVGEILSWGVKPDEFQITYTPRSKILGNLNWDDIITHNNFNESCNNINHPEHATCAMILREIGFKCGATYENGQTGTSLPEIRAYLSSFPTLTIGDVKDYKNIEESAYYYNLKRGVVVRTGTNSFNMGHVWIEDGYRYYEVSEWYYEKKESATSWTLISYQRKNELYVHINWGWNGDGNGYFLFGITNPTKIDDVDKDPENSGNILGLGYSNNKYFVVTSTLY